MGKDMLGVGAPKKKILFSSVENNKIKYSKHLGNLKNNIS